MAATLGTNNRDAVIPVDAPQLFPPGMTTPTASEYASAGTRLRGILTANQLGVLCRNNREPSDEVIGRAYFDARVRAFGIWNRNGNLQDQWAQDPAFGILLRTPIELYRQARDTLNACLKDNRILIAEFGAAVDTSDSHLTRREYLGLLAVIWAGKEADVRAAVERGITGLRLLLLAESAIIMPSQEVYVRLVSENDSDSTPRLTQKVSPTMSAGELRTYEERRNKQRLTLWERECEEEDLDELRLTVQDYQKGVEQYRVQLRLGNPNRQTDPAEFERIERMIWFLEQKIDIARRVRERRLKEGNPDG